MKILHVIDTLGVGGKERQFVELVKGLHQHKDIKQMIVCMSNDDYYLGEIKLLNIPMIYIIRNIRHDTYVFWRLYKVIKYYEPDVIHTNSVITSFYSLPLSKLLKINLINGLIRNAFDSGGFMWKLGKFLLKYSDYIVSNSEAGLISRKIIFNPKKNVVIHNGFDLNRIKGNTLSSNDPVLQVIRNKSVVGMVAEFSDYKDYDTFMTAAINILNKRDDIIFLAIGDGKNFHHYKNIVCKNINGIKFIGQVKNVEAYVQYFHVGVLTTYTEGISNAIMEYMAFGKPVISSAGGGSKELVIDDETGYLIPTKSPVALMSKILYLIDNPTIAKNMGMAGRKRIETIFTLDTMIEKYITLFSSVKK